MARPSASQSVAPVPGLEEALGAPASNPVEALYRRLTKLSSDWLWTMDEELRFTSFLNHEGPVVDESLRQQSAVGLRRWEVPGTDPADPAWARHRQQVAARQPFRDFEFSRIVEGRARWFRASGDPVFDEAGAFRGYEGVTRDITREREAAERLRAAQTMLQFAAQIGRLGGWTWDIGARRVAWSSEVCAIHDMPPDFQPTPEESLRFVVPEHQQRFRQVLRACSRKGTAFDVEVQVTTARGRLVWVRLICEPQWDAAGRFARLHGACQDISESRHSAEQVRELAQQLLGLNAELEKRVRSRTAQLEAANQELEAFSYSIAHDLRAPLSTIDGFSRLLERGAGDALDAAARGQLERIRMAVRHMGQLTDDLLALANLSRGELHREPLDIAALARDALAACREQEPDRQVQADIAASLPARGDPRLVAQVLGNLVGNAWKFTGRVSPARIVVGSTEEVGPQGAETVFFVRDNGAGFDMAHAGKLFEAFERLHRAHEFRGTGIGLAIVQKIVRRHGGRVWAQAEPGRGACFFFTLPDSP